MGHAGPLSPAIGLMNTCWEYSLTVHRSHHRIKRTIHPGTVFSGVVCPGKNPTVEEYRPKITATATRTINSEIRVVSWVPNHSYRLRFG